MSTSESSTMLPNNPIPASQTPMNTSKIPLLGEGFQESASRPLSKSVKSDDVELDSEATKSGKRRLFGFGKKKKEDDKTKSSQKGDSTPTASNASVPIAQPTAQKGLAQTSPSRQSHHPYGLPTSPQRNLYSSSPRVVSPAGSQIFERDVQEGSVPVPNSPAIPTHILSENRIPPVLDASSEAITNHEIDPDTVEIVMHSSHQPAAVTVTGIESSQLRGETWADDLVAHPDKDDAASNYGALDSTDVRRLSFISFSDIVQSEHQHAGSRDSLYIAGLSSLSSGGYRSPSPVRSPVSSQDLEGSPPTSNSASVKGIEISPRAKALASPVLSSHGSISGGELTIETMSQALRRTGSRDLGGIRSQPLSPVSTEGPSDQSFH
jgi:hypothetical protein